MDAIGTKAIIAEAERWFDVLPGAAWTVQLPFGESSGKMVGAMCVVTHERCAVTVGIVFEVNEAGLISRELIHYDPATLRACGWVD